MRVPLFDMSAELAPIRAEVDAAIARVLDSGVFVGGPEVAALETELAAAAGARHAVGVSSGTDALVATFMALGLGPGDSIVTTPFTFFATAGAALRLGARVIFADLDDTTLNLDPRAALAAADATTRAIVPVDLYGLPARHPATDLPIVVDGAQSLGAGFTGRPTTVSFFPTKNVGALGDAGAVLTDDAALADRLALLRTQGARPKYHHVAVGGNFRLDPLQAAVLRVKLAHLPAWTATRRAHAADYRARFAAARVPPEVRLPPDAPTHVYHQFTIRTPRRDALRAHLAAAGIGTEVYYPEPLHRQPAIPGPHPALPVAERAAAEALSLPIHPTLTAEARAYVVDHIVGFFRK